MSITLSVQALTTRFGNRDFRYDLTLHGPGLVAVTGPSGAGKSTLFHLIAGFEPPLSGRALLDGSDFSQLAPGQRPLTYIFQDHNLFAHLDVFANVGLGLSPSLALTEADRAEIGDALEKVGLKDFGPRMPQALSGGERQRVAFARALVRKRPLLLLDEPFASLDPELRHDMGSLLLSLMEDRPMLVLMITHDFEEVRRLAQTVVTIDAGTVAYAGNVDLWRAQWKTAGKNP